MSAPKCPTPNKQAYTELQAQAAETWYAQRAYQCPCGQWHMTSTKRSKRLMRKRHKFKRQVQLFRARA